MRWWFIAAVVLLSAGPAAAAEFPISADDTVVGNLRDYTVQSGDNLADVARRFDIGYTEMLAANPGVDPWSPPVGRTLTIPSLYILPDAPRRGIVINLGERRLYYFPPRSHTVQTYPIGIGAIGFDTPLSTTTVVRKEPNPVWIPPPSIRAEQPDLPERIGPGPDDPLGAFALRLGWPNYLIHGTNKPDGVGRNVSHGCIHLYPEDIEKLFNAVAVGTPVRVVNQQAAAAWIAIGLYVEVHPTKDQADQIDMEQPVTPTPLAGLRELIAAAAGDHWGDVDWRAVDQAGRDRTGLPVLVAKRPPAPETAANEAPPPAQPAPPAADAQSLTPIFNMLQAPPGTAPAVSAATPVLPSVADDQGLPGNPAAPDTGSAYRLPDAGLPAAPAPADDQPTDLFPR